MHRTQHTLDLLSSYCTTELPKHVKHLAPVFYLQVNSDALKFIHCFIHLYYHFKRYNIVTDFVAVNNMAQMCSLCSIPLCGRTVTKTRLELNAEFMVIIIIIVILIIITINITVIPS
jgi:hypothetical protein